MQDLSKILIIKQKCKIIKQNIKQNFFLTVSSDKYITDRVLSGAKLYSTKTLKTKRR